LKFLGQRVKHVMNITDFDDKTIKGATQNQISLSAFTEPFTEAFFEDIHTLNIEPADAYPRATHYIPDMIVMIEKLLQDGVAYKGADESVYFAIKRFPSYGRLSHLHLDELQINASERLTSDEYDKENVSDFVLWKSYDPERDGKIFWQSPFGPGRPGWHLECSAMVMKLLGESIDIHAGGVDNIFPHHENEIAQSEAYSCKRFVAHWVHAEHLLVDHKKMSKSLGNFYTLRDLLQKGYSGPQIRYMLMQVHYRTQLNFTLSGLSGAASSLERLSDFIFRLREIAGEETSGALLPLLERTEAEFTAALADDLNISAALASLFELVRQINALCDANKVSKKEAEATLALLMKFNQVLAVLDFEEESIPAHLQEALEKRQQARAQKDWPAADRWRDVILASGYIIDDTKSGARLKRKGS
jgi:cysteinyl-tRNA synthetase